MGNDPTFGLSASVWQILDPPMLSNLFSENDIDFMVIHSH